MAKYDLEAAARVAAVFARLQEELGKAGVTLEDIDRVLEDSDNMSGAVNAFLAPRRREEARIRSYIKVADNANLTDIYKVLQQAGEEFVELYGNPEGLRLLLEASLRPWHQAAVCLYFGLDGAEGKKRADIAKVLRRDTTSVGEVFGSNKTALVGAFRRGHKALTTPEAKKRPITEIETIGLSTEIQNLLLREGVETLEQFHAFYESGSFADKRQVGPKKLGEVEAVLRGRGLIE